VGGNAPYIPKTKKALRASRDKDTYGAKKTCLRNTFWKKEIRLSRDTIVHNRGGKHKTEECGKNFERKVHTRGGKEPKRRKSDGIKKGEQNLAVGTSRRHRRYKERRGTKKKK